MHPKPRSSGSMQAWHMGPKRNTRLLQGIGLKYIKQAQHTVECARQNKHKHTHTLHMCVH